MSEIKTLAARWGVFFVNFHSCMWGAKRRKRTSLLTNMPPMKELVCQCAGKHEHLPWGVRWKDGWSFATVDECEYPKELCFEIALQAARFANVTIPGEAPRRRKQKSRPSIKTLGQRATVGKQPRSSKVRPLVP